MPDHQLSYAVKTAVPFGVTRDLPHGPDDLQWVANSVTLIYGEEDAVLIDTFTSIDQNAELVEWVASIRQEPHTRLHHTRPRRSFLRDRTTP